ncbi:hybrid sensor histidine kinase/response regulator [Halobacteriales archaeon QS_1_68_17]|nr:MAG: hybrid sensor histidine kinase/response regulator [Halobacteriales archaeon QS_1_68_17]
MAPADESPDGPRDAVVVLHVDDDREFAALTAESLEREDSQFRVVTEQSAGDGIERLAAGGIDCIVSDYEMPGMNGLEFLDRVRDIDRNVPFILFTGRGSEEVASEAISAGVTDYLQKEPGGDQYAVLANRVRNAVERYRLEREQARSQEGERYRSIVEAAGDPLFALDARGRFTYLNGALVDLTGYDEDVLLGADVARILVREDARRGSHVVRSVLSGDDGSRTTELRVFRRDGSRIPCEIKITRFSFGGTSGAVGVARDVSERREYERTLRRERARYSALFENTDDAVALVEYDGETPYIQDANGAFDSLFASPDADVVGRPLDEVVAAKERREEARDISQRVKEGTYMRGELERDTVDGPRTFLWQAVPLADPETGTVDQAFAVYRDISRLRERERELERQNERLKEFSSIVSHDLRNPLNVAQGNLELARATGESDRLDAVERAHRRMEDLIEDMLTLAREGESVTETEPVDVGELVADCWEMIRTDGTRLDLRTRQTVEADPGRFRQLLENLLSNSVEHGGTGITVGDLDGGLYVEDDGPGIPEDERERVFDPGYSTREDGTGFGLRIVREIADAHGWEVTVTDGSGGGARFEITGMETVR